MSKEDCAYRAGWNAWLDSKSQDDNPWVECSDAGCAWMRGYTEVEKLADEVGTDQVERAK